MIRKSLLFFILIICNFCYCQEIKTDNNITGIISNTNTSQLGLTFVGENSFNKKKWDIASVTNYTLTFSPKISENELMQRLSFDWRASKWSYFTSYQFNYSYVRNIQSDNLIGIGTGIKKEIKWFKGSISYAILFQNSNYLILPSEYLFRHSVRFKFKIERKNWELASEYYYQPDVTDFNNTIIYGTTKISLYPQNKLQFTIGDILNYRSQSSVKLIHNLTIGVGYKFDKKIKN